MTIFLSVLWIQFAKQALAENLELHNLAKFCKILNDITEMPFTFLCIVSNLGLMQHN